MIIGLGLSPFRSSGQSRSAYWATLISATVENAAPTHVVLTFPTAQASLGATDFTIEGFTISSASWTGAVLTLVLSEAVLFFDGDLAITFITTGQTATVTNNVADDGHSIVVFDWSDTATITKDGSNKVSKWADRLGTGNDLVQANDTKKFISDADGLLADGINDFMKSPAIAAMVQPLKYYILYKRITPGSAGYWFDGNTLATALVYGLTPPIARIFAGADGPSNPNATSNVWHIARIWFNGANSYWQIDDTAATSAGNAGNSNPGGITLASSGNGLATFTSIQYKMFIVRDSEDNEAAIYASMLKKKNL